MDGQHVSIGEFREELDQLGFGHSPILSYAALPAHGAQVVHTRLGGLVLRLGVARVREHRVVVLDEEVLVEAAALARGEDVREVDRAGADVLEVGLVRPVLPRAVLDVVSGEAARVAREVLKRVLTALDDPEQVELELDEVRIGPLEQDVVERRAVRLLVRELEIVVVVEELQPVLACELTRAIELLG